MAHFHDNALVGASGQGGYQISRSLRFHSADSAYLNRGMSAGSGRKKFTISFWTKISKFGTNRAFVEAYFNGTNFLLFGLDNSDKIINYSIQGGTDYGYVYTPIYRDPSAWYHFMTTWDTDNATATQRIRTYVNGVEITAKAADYGDPPLGYVTDFFNTGFTHSIGRRLDTGVYYDGLMTEFYVIDGQALTPSSFGETDTITGVWKPKKYTGTYGTNGFYLNFSDNSGTTSTTLGKDSSGNSNNWTPNNFSVTAGAGNDSLIDTPTPYADGGNGRGNYCTANPLNSNASTLRNGNLEFIGDTGSSYAKGILGTIAVSSGKWYFEVTPDSGGTFYIGVAPSTGSGIGNVDLEYINGAYSYRGNGDKVQGTGGSGTSSAYGNTYVSPDVIGVALDLDNGAIYFAKNNTWQNSGVPTSGSSKTGAAFTSFSGSYVPMACGFNGATATLNFGQRPFAYTPPSGFVALNTQNLPEPSIKKPSTYIDVQTYTGSASALTLNTSINPENDALFWFKMRSSVGTASWNQHFFVDSKRLYLGSTKYWQILSSNSTNAESADGSLVTTFTSSSITKGTGNSNTNETGKNYAMWAWQAAATPGFDIVTYTGNGAARTIAHSLGVAPSMMVIKRRDAAENWGVYHTSLGNTQYVYLDQTQGANASANVWNNTSPTSSVFSVAGSTVVNASGGTYVAYLWSEVAGFSRFGSYTGNGSTDGPFVFCNFRPRWLMIKRTDTTASWMLVDAARDTYNMVTKGLYPNLSDAEGTGDDFDFTSNGFKLRDSGTQNNASGGTYVFAAFSESPFKYALAR